MKTFLTIFFFRWNTINRSEDNTEKVVDLNIHRQSDFESTLLTQINVVNCHSSSRNNMAVKSSSKLVDNLSNEKHRYKHDEEAETQRKYRSAQARRERRATQRVILEDIKLNDEQQVYNRTSNETLSSSSSSSSLVHNQQTTYKINDFKKSIHDENQMINENNQVKLIQFISMIHFSYYR